MCHHGNSSYKIVLTKKHLDIILGLVGVYVDSWPLEYFEEIVFPPFGCKLDCAVVLGVSCILKVYRISSNTS